MQPNNLILYPAAALVGMVIGSFLGLVADRWPRGEAIAAGRSRCRSCNVSLRAWDLVPIASYCLQGGRCCHCRVRLPIDLLLAELGGAVVAIIALHSASDFPEALAFGLFSGALLLLALLDARHFWLPDAVTLPLVLAGLASIVILPEPGLANRLVGAVLGYSSLALLRLAYRIMRGHEGLGGGDPKLLAAIGAWLGATMLPAIVLGASLMALVWAGIKHLRGGGVGRMTVIPLGTPLAIAAIAALAWTG